MDQRVSEDIIDILQHTGSYVHKEKEYINCENALFIVCGTKFPFAKKELN
jgi:hypothetical protein